MKKHLMITPKKILLQGAKIAYETIITSFASGNLKGEIKLFIRKFMSNLMRQ